MIANLPSTCEDSGWGFGTPRDKKGIYYRHSYAAIICYDPLDLESFQSIKYWIQELQKVSDGIKIYICATKQGIIEAKKKVVVDAKDVQDLIKKYDAKYFETSAKTGTNVK